MTTNKPPMNTRDAADVLAQLRTSIANPITLPQYRAALDLAIASLRAGGRVGVGEAWHRARNAWMKASRHGTQEAADAAAIAVLIESLAGPVVAGEVEAVKCRWSQQDYCGDWISTQCGNEFVLNDAGQHKDGEQVFPHCPYCAKPTTFRRWSSVYADTAKGKEPR